MKARVVQAAGATLLAALVATGCGTQARRVNCEGRLEPINRPAPVGAREPIRSEPAPTEPAAP